MKYLLSAEWWQAAGIRAVKTMCQTGAALTSFMGFKRSDLNGTVVYVNAPYALRQMG